MRTLNHLAVVVCLFATTLALALSPEARGEAPAVSIAHWSGDRTAAVTFTFDDSYPVHLTTVVPIFKEFGYRCTFYINSDRVGPPQNRTLWEDWKAAAEDGFEVGNHTPSHKIDMKDQAQATADINAGYDAIEKNIGIAPLTFAFPGGTQNPVTLKAFADSKHIAYRRQIQLDLDKKKVKTEWTRVWFNEKKTNAEGFPEVAARALSYEEIWTGAKISWVVGLIHKVPDDVAQGLREALTYVQEHDDEIWCVTYARAELYDAEREQSAVKIASQNATSVTFTVTNDLDEAVYNEPLTIKIQPSSSPGAPSAKRGKKALPTSVKDGVILVDVVPGSEPVSVTW